MEGQIILTKAGIGPKLLFSVLSLSRVWIDLLLLIIWLFPLVCDVLFVVAQGFLD